MRYILIDLSSDNHLSQPEFFGGYAGEHNETVLQVKLPKRLINTQYSKYHFYFQTSEDKEISSPSIPPSSIINDTISCELTEELTVAGKLLFSVAAINENNSVLLSVAKTNEVTLHIYDSPDGSTVMSRPVILSESSNVSNSLKGIKSGAIVVAKDVSPIEHNLSVKLTSDTITDFSGITVSRYGKNLFNPKILTDAGFSLNSNGYYVGKVKTLNDFYDGYNGQLPLPDFIPNTQYTISFEGYTQKDISSSGGIYIRISYTDNTNDYLQLSVQTIKKYSRTTQKNKSVQKISVSYGAEGESLAYIKNFMICVGSDDEFEEYKLPKVYNSSYNGVVNKAISLYPSVTLLTDSPEVNIEMEYNRDINKAFAELQQAIISLGGSI